MPRGPVGHAQRAARLVELLQCMARADKSGLAEFYEVTSPFVYGIALQILGSPQLATVVTQEVYVEVWRLAPRYDPSERSVLAWMMAIAHRHAVERRRAVGSQSAAEPHAGWNGDRALTRDEGGGESRMDAELARKALSSLSDSQRQVVTLAYFEGYSQNDVAGVLGLPVDTVRTMLRDGLIGLRNALGVGP